MPLYALDDHAPEVADPDRIWIAPDAQVIGRVHLGLDVGIWFGAALRGDNEPIRIGDRTNVQEGAIMHVDPGFPLVIGTDVTVGHGAIVHGCTIGDGSLVGMGATVLNGAPITASSSVRRPRRSAPSMPKRWRACGRRPCATSRTPGATEPVCAASTADTASGRSPRSMTAAPSSRAQRRDPG